MFTSRAEYRILLRQDDADRRLTPKGHALGLIGAGRLRDMESKYEAVERVRGILCETGLTPREANGYLESVGSAPIDSRRRMGELLTRPGVSLQGLIDAAAPGTLPDLGLDDAEPQERAEILEDVEIAVKYQGYIERERRLADKILRLENIRIPENFDFEKVTSLSIECRIKLNRYRPATIAQASRISGVSPADISVLLVYFGR